MEVRDACTLRLTCAGTTRQVSDSMAYRGGAQAGQRGSTSVVRQEHFHRVNVRGSCVTHAFFLVSHASLHKMS